MKITVQIQAQIQNSEVDQVKEQTLLKIKGSGAATPN